MRCRHAKTLKVVNRLTARSVVSQC